MGEVMEDFAMNREDQGEGGPCVMSIGEAFEL
jgi:hypothetical protein